LIWPLDAEFTPDKVTIRYEEHGFITRDIFRKWAIRSLLPAIAFQYHRALEKSSTFDQPPAMLFDECGQDIDEAILDEI
jgi:hypothetical protein